MSGVFGNPWLYNPSDDFFSTTIDNSLRFTASQTPYLTFGQTKTPTDIAKWTVNFWLKRTEPLDESDDYDTVWGVEGPGNTAFTFLNSNLYLFINYADTGGQARLITNRKFRDPSSWYNFHVSFDRANSTNAHKVRLYVNGVEETSFSTDERNLIDSSTSTGWNVNGQSAAINRRSGTQDTRYHNGYLAQFYNIDGQALDPTSFIEISDGVCKPKDYTGSFGNQGWLLEFKESGVGTGASNTVGADTSGNDNHWSSFNVESHDQTADSPTQNHCQLLPMENIALSEGNLEMTTSRTGNWDGTIGSFGVTSGKWYYEVRMSKTTDSTFRCVAGWQGNQALQSVTYHGEGGSGSPYNTLFDNYQVSSHTTYFYKDGGVDGTTTAPSSGDVINIAADFDNGKIYFGINGTYYANDGGTDGDPAGGTNESLSGIDLTASEYVPAFHIRSDNSTGGNQMIVNFGQEGTFVGTKTAGGNSDANGVGNFFNPVPSGFLALVASNLPDVTIGPQGDSIAIDHFEAVTYSGSNSNQDITTTSSFRPDLVWVKGRTNATGGNFFDSVRGANITLFPNDSNVSFTASDRLMSFNSDGFTVGTNTNVSGNGRTYVSWNWKAGGATPTQTYKVHVDSDGGQNKYRFRNSADDATFATYAPTVTLQEGGTYVFDWSHSSAQAHPIRFSTTSDGTHGGGTEYTTGVVKDDSAYKTTITVAASAPTLYYYCQYHSGMGGQVNTNSTFGSSNFDGTIQSIVTANNESGFSITKFTGNGSNSTVGHGLTSAPKTLWIKRTSGTFGSTTGNWFIFHSAAQATGAHVGYFQLTNAFSASNQIFQNTQPASKVFSVGTANSNVNNAEMMAYCFANVDSFSKFSSFRGNQSNDGTFVNLGFEPALIFLKKDDSGVDWNVFDNKRLGYNVDNNNLRAMAAGAATEQTDDDIDFLSNGFKIRRNYANNAGTVLYWCWAKTPFKFSNAR